MKINLINDIKISFKKINYKLLMVIFLTLFIPLIYQTLRMSFIGSMPNTWSYSIAGNIQWINILFEVLDESFLLPLFFIIGSIVNKKIKNKNRKIIGSAYLIFIIYLFFVIIFIFASSPLLKWISPKTHSPLTLKYIRIEFFNKLTVIISKISITILLIKNKWKNIIFILLIHTMLNVILDIFMISSLDISANLGIIGIAYNNLISGLFMVVIYLINIFFRLEIKKEDFKRPIFRFNLKKSFSQFAFSGIESFVRNAFFVFFVLKTINKLSDGSMQGIWWATNAFIWNWLLIPIFALSQYMNRDSSLNNDKPFKERFLAIFIIITFIIIIWLIAIPAYEPFIKNVLLNKNHKLMNELVILSLGFYVIFAYNEIIDKSFYGEGKSEYLLIQSLFTNIIVYIPFYFLVETMTIQRVAIMFGISMTVDSLLTFVMFIYWHSKKRIKVQ